MPGYADKRLTLDLASKLEREAELQKAGWSDRFSEHRKLPLKEHLIDWRDDLLARGTTPKHADLVFNRAQKVFDACPAVFLPDVAMTDVQRFIGRLRDDGFKSRTRNHYLGAACQFSRWLKDQKRTPDDMLAGMKPETVADEDEGGVFDSNELRTLLSETERGPMRRGMTGFERRLFYELAASTGFRSKECRMIRWGDVGIDADPPTVTVTAKRAKNRRRYDQPLTASLVRMLRHWQGQCSGTGSEDLVFPVTPDRTRVASLLREDMHAAGLPEHDPAGRPRNFHSLRHSFGSSLARAGVSPKVAMELMRHSDVNLTLKRYSHTFLPDRADAIEKLPDLSTGPESDAMRATGTYDESSAAISSGISERKHNPGHRLASMNDVSKRGATPRCETQVVQLAAICIP